MPLSAAAGGDILVLACIRFRKEKLRANKIAEALISTREQTQAMIEHSERRYQRLLENINDAIVVNNLEGVVVFANRRFREWFGIEEEAWGHASIEQWVAPEWRPLVRDVHRRCTNGERAPDHFEYEGLRADGSRLWIEMLITGVEEDGRIVGTQAALRDVTERKRLEAQFLQAQKMESIGRLAGGIAHDFNNLLTVINGYSDLLMHQLSKEDPARGPVEHVIKAGNQAAELTEQLLAFSRKQAARPKPLNLNAMVEEAHALLRRIVREDIEIVLAPEPGLALVMADSGQIHQVLMNLAVNARDSMPKGGRLTIQTANVIVDERLIAEHPELKPGAYVRLSIADTGAGMNEVVKSRIFEPFFTTKEKGKGTGLGLATVYGIVRQSRGGIWADSEIGQGSTFHVYLPKLEQPAYTEVPARPRAAALLGSETILVVEDQAAVRQLAADALEKYGYRVLHAASGPEAIALAQRFPETIHLLLTDVILPGMNGREVAVALQAARPGIRVLFTSGYPDDMTGGAAHLTKPFTPETMVASVRQALSGRGTAGQG